MFGVQAGGNSGPDNHAHSSNDVQQAQALSLTINKSTLAPAEVSSSLSQAIAAAMESAMESTIRYESAALLIATANTVNVSAAVPLVAQAFRQVTTCLLVFVCSDGAHHARVAMSPTEQ